MSTPLFSLTTPRFAEGKNNSRQDRRLDYAMMKLYPEGKLVYRFYKLNDPHPKLQNRQIQLTPEELTKFNSLLAERKNILLAYLAARPVPFEARRRQHTLIHAYGQLFLLPDYVVDFRTSVYRNRYVYYPEPKTKAYYDALFGLANRLHQILIDHQVRFNYQEHLDGDYYSPKKKK